MGDMKTPDFDDLLAAFDIPDIDAKEAIQSSPEEGHGEERPEDNIRNSVGPSSPCLSAPHIDTPVVSVIVENRVRPDSSGEIEGPTNPSNTDPEKQSKLDGILMAPQLNHKVSDVPFEPPMQNGFEGSVLKAQKESNGDLWTHQSPLCSTPTPAKAASGRRTPENVSRLKPLSPRVTTGGPSVAFTSITTSSPPTVSDNHHPPLQSTQSKDTTCLPSSPSSPPPFPPSRTARAGTRPIITSEEDDSEPDLGGPLVIQESPGSPMSSPPRFTAKARKRSRPLGSPPSPAQSLPCPPPLSSSLTSSKLKPQMEEEGPSTPKSPCPALQQQGPSSTLPASATAKEEYPEHVIDERDSPESPPPDQTGFVFPRKSPNPAPARASSHEESLAQEEPMDSEPSQGSRPGETGMVEGDRGGATEGGSANEKTSGAEAPPMSTQEIDATGAAPPPGRPLKVKIKMVKTPTGSITRTVTRVAAKGAGGVLYKGVDSTKASPSGGGRKVVGRPKRTTAQPPQEEPTATPASLVPAASTLQGASAAMLVAVSKVQNWKATEAQPGASAAAVSITRSAALPPVSTSSSSSSPRISPGGGINIRSLGQKTLTGGATGTSTTPLVPSQGGSRPASIVNNTGAIISKSQSSLVEAFNKILNSKNLLPSYKPDLTSPLPAEWGLPLPTQGYRCLECGDAFALERSLARHYDRRSLRIEVTCNHCAKRLAFFNKCSLLLHAREHKERGLVMQCSHLVMRPVAVEQMIGQPDPTPAGVLCPPPPPSAASSAPPSTAPANAAQLPQQALANRRAEVVQYTSNKCPECQVQFCSKAEVAAHFQEVKPSHSNSCTECSPPMLLPNDCSAAAHQRFHKACAPYVCPECGGTAKEATFRSHLEEACLHFTRRIGYRCSSCQVVFGGLNSVKAHIEAAHCDTFHKCPSCPMAFKSAASAQAHISAQHPTLTEGQAKVIYKCVMCDTVFTQKSLLHTHFDTHLAKQKVHVFKCPECTKLYSQRNSLMEHIKSAHRGPAVKQEAAPSVPPVSKPDPSVKAESSDGEEWKDQEEEEEERDEDNSNSSPEWSCIPCHARYSNKEDYITHMAEQHDKILKKFPCNKCESSFTSTSSLRRHIRVKHKGIPRGFRCQLCPEGKKAFSSQVMLERHVQLRHSMDGLSQDTLMKRGAEDADSSSEQDARSRPPHGRRVRKERGGEDAAAGRASPAKKTRAAAPPSPSPLPPSTASGLRSAPGGSSLQCVECGAAFTSAPSLSRHRFIAHRVRGAPGDGRRADRTAPPPHNGGCRRDAGPSSPHPTSEEGEGEWKAEGEGEGKLACKVCGRCFEKPSDLSTHFRTHGMAFISARNAAKTTS